MLSIKNITALVVCLSAMTLTPPSAHVMGQEQTQHQASVVDTNPTEDAAPVRRLRAEGYGGYGGYGGAPTGGKSYGGGGYGGNGYSGGASTGGRRYGSGKTYGGGGTSFGGNSYGGGKSYGGGGYGGGGAPLGGLSLGDNGYGGGKSYSGGGKSYGSGGIPVVFGSFPAPAGNTGGYAQGGYLNGDAFAPATVAPMDSASVGTSYGDSAPATGPASDGYTVQTGGAY